jgi:hypothetical protein
MTPSSQTPVTAVPGAEQYLSSLPVQVPEPLCAALAAELAEEFEVEALLTFARRCGARWAGEHLAALTPVDSMADLIAMLNACWASLHWGWVAAEEHHDRLLLRHALLPLGRIYGPQQADWSLGFVEGFYEEAFRWAGAEGTLQVRAISDPQDASEVQFEVTA